MGHGPEVDPVCVSPRLAWTPGVTSQYAPENRGRRGGVSRSGLARKGCFLGNERRQSFSLAERIRYRQPSGLKMVDKLIVVDDELDVRTTVVNFLVDAGYCVMQAENGA